MDYLASGSGRSGSEQQNPSPEFPFCVFHSLESVAFLLRRVNRKPFFRYAVARATSTQAHRKRLIIFGNWTI
jgi:hypothetical protein